MSNLFPNWFANGQEPWANLAPGQSIITTATSLRDRESLRNNVLMFFGSLGGRSAATHCRWYVLYVPGIRLIGRMCVRKQSMADHSSEPTETEGTKKKTWLPTALFAALGSGAAHLIGSSGRGVTDTSLIRLMNPASLDSIGFRHFCTCFYTDR